jgi:SAM-dependent methyltransferase
MLETTTTPGLHDFLFDQVLRKRPLPGGGEAVDLGGGTGALAERLREMGWRVTAADLNPSGFGANGVPIVQTDFNDPDFASKLGKGRFDLVTSTEVIEHVESPIGFLRNIGWLLKPGGFAVLTTPNVDSAAARLSFLVKGKVRMMDEHGEPTHISPIFWDLLMRQYLPRAGLRLVEHRVFPPEGYVHSRRQIAWALKTLAKLWRSGGESILGDNHIIVLERAP